jgi:FtsH-binding integral membrane protein
MCVGLAITAGTAWLIAGSPATVVAIATHRLLFWALMGAQLGLVFVLAARVDKLAASTAAMLFVLYSALTGVTISFVLLAYTGESVAPANRSPIPFW